MFRASKALVGAGLLAGVEAQSASNEPLSSYICTGTTCENKAVCLLGMCAPQCSEVYSYTSTCTGSTNLIGQFVYVKLDSANGCQTGSNPYTQCTRGAGAAACTGDACCTDPDPADSSDDINCVSVTGGMAPVVTDPETCDADNANNSSGQIVCGKWDLAGASQNTAGVAFGLAFLGLLFK